MKQLTTAVVAAIVTLGASAEGYQVNTFSAKQEGMGHVGVAMKLGAESQIFNPGALAFMNKTMEISGAMSGIKATANAYLPDGTKVTSSNKVSTPMNFSAAFRIYDNLYAGVTLYTPYGSSINWGKNWAGAALNQSVDLKVFDVQPTISWRVLPNLSVGAGLMIAWGSVNLNKALVSGTSLDRVAQLQYQAAKLQWDVANATHLLNPSRSRCRANGTYRHLRQRGPCIGESHRRFRTCSRIQRGRSLGHKRKMEPRSLVPLENEHARNCRKCRSGIRQRSRTPASGRNARQPQLRQFRRLHALPLRAYTRHKLQAHPAP